MSSEAKKTTTETIYKPARTDDSFYPDGLIKPTEDQLMVPTWSLVAFLILGFFVLKAFIYIKDDKRHGK